MARMAELRADPVRVRVPATSANLGPGFDSFGLALAWYDEVTARVTGSGLRITVTGEGSGSVPHDGTHLVASAMTAAFDQWGSRPDGLELTCVNSVPHGRGLGSSAAAIVAGLVTARGMLAAGGRVSDADLLDLAARIEGHPDNVSACLFGGLTIAWAERDRPRCIRLTPHDDVRPVMCIPPWTVSTEKARGLLPELVPHHDATFNVSRAGLLVAALTSRPDLLLAATEDRLHQDYREDVLGESVSLVRSLREAGVPAVISGAGPSVLAFGRAHNCAVHAPTDWSVRAVPVDSDGATVSIGSAAESGSSFLPE